MAGVDQPVQLRHQSIDISRMQTGGGFVQHVKRVASLLPLQLGGQLDPLRLATGQLGSRLAQAQIAQPHLAQRGQCTRQRRHLVAEEVAGGIDAEPQHLGDVPALPADRQRVVVVARAVTGRARCIHRRQKQQSHRHEALAFTCRAPPLGHIERKAAGVVFALARLGRGSKQLAHLIEQPGIGGQIGARRATDRPLIYLYQPRHRIHARLDATTDRCRHIFSRQLVSIIIRLVVHTQPGTDQFHQRLADQTRLARAGDATHRSHHAKRKGHVQTLHIVAFDADQPQPVDRLAHGARRHRRHIEQIATRVRSGAIPQTLGRPAVKHATALLAGIRSDIDDPFGGADHGQFVLHHEHRIATGLQLRQCTQQGFRVGRMQAGGGFVQHIDHAEQLRPQLRRQPQPLQFAGRQRGRAAIQRQVAQAQVREGIDAGAHVGDNASRDQRLFRVRFIADHVRRTAQMDGQLTQRKMRRRGDIAAAERHRQRLAPQPLAPALGTRAGYHEARHALLDAGAGRAGEGVHHVVAGADIGALVVARLAARMCGARHFGCHITKHRHYRLLGGEQDPVPFALRQLAPRPIHVMTQAYQNVAVILALPALRPAGDGALANAQRGIGHHRGLGRIEHLAQPMALRAGPGGRVGRERVGLQQRLPGRIVAGTRVQHAQGVGDRAEAAYSRTCTAGATTLLQRDRWRQSVDGIHVRHAGLLDQPSCIRRHRLEIAPLRLGIHGTEGQRRLARTRHAGKHHQRIARQVDIDVLEVVLPRAAYTHAAVVIVPVSGYGWHLAGHRTGSRRNDRTRRAGATPS